MSRHPLEDHIAAIPHHPLSAPIKMKLDEKLAGPFGELRRNAVYKSGKEHFIVISGDTLKPDNISFDLFKRSHEGFELVAREIHKDPEIASRKLVQVIEQNGALIAADKEDVYSLAKHLWNKLDGIRQPTPEQSLDTHCLNTIISKDKPLIGQSVAKRLESIAQSTFMPDLETLNHGASAAEKTAPRKIPVQSGPLNPPHNPVTHTPSIAPETAAKEGRFARFLREEKLIGKKGLIIAGAVAAIGVVIYGVSKLGAREDKPEKSR